MERKFLNNGLFEKPFMNSRIKTEKVSLSEKIIGYGLGPFGCLAVQAAVNQLAELYYTEVFYIDNIFGVGTYLVMSWTSKVVSVIFGLVLAYIVEHSYSSQGKIRPFILMGSMIMSISGFMMFAIPEMNNTAMLIWAFAANILYNGIGSTMFALRTNMLTLSTREQKDRNQISVIDKTIAFMFVGVAVTMIIGSIFYYSMLHGFPKRNWIILMGIISLISLPLNLLNYFYTKERVTLENEEVEGAIYNKSTMPVKQQLKALFSSKYWVMAFLITIVTTIAGNLQGFNLNTNFCTVILGADAQNNYNLYYTIASGIPMGIGILLVYPLCNRFTIRKTTIAFALMAVIGCVMGYIAGNSFILAVIANFIFNMGTLPAVYILQSLLYSANDEVEYKYGFRCEGTIALALTTSLATIITGVFTGVYETGLSYFGYMGTAGQNQPAGVINWIMFIKYMIPMIEYILIIIILFFLNIEEKLPQMQKEIHERHNQELSMEKEKADESN